MKNTIYSKEHKLLVKKLKESRIIAGLSQKETAILLGKTQSYLSKVENGQRRIDIFELIEFAKIYNKSLTHFIKEEK